ncbi:MAG: TIGR04282 family arsenosugar biosynthesis glycosyltransferase [Thermodesulfobacteriota bacterium]
MAAPERLIIFTRLPQPGRAKTRLIPALGPQGAADLQRRLVERLLVQARALAAARPLELELCFTDGTAEEARAWLGPGLSYQPQGSGDLGRRMDRALHRALAQGAERVVLVGTDLPELDQAILAAALEALADHDLALGPATDGGYYLVGLRAAAPGLLTGEHGRSLAALRGRAAELGLRTAMLPELSDLDTPADLARWLARPDAGPS